MNQFKKIGRVLLLILVLSVALTSSYIYFISPKHLKVTTYTYSSTKIDSNLSGMRIAFLSDFNLYEADDLSYLKKVIKKLNKQSYDMVILGGDLYESSDLFKTKSVISALSKIDCNYGKFAVYGDKDLKHKKEIKSIYSQAGIELINNTARTIYYKDSSFELVACDSKTKISSVIESSNKLIIDITHQPDSFKDHANNIDLQLSGHSLGGSFYLPLVGGIKKDTGFKTYNHGKYTKNNATLIVSNGIKGSHKTPYKLFCSNQINIIKLVSKTKKSK